MRRTLKHVCLINSHYSHKFTLFIFTELPVTRTVIVNDTLKVWS